MKKIICFLLLSVVTLSSCEKEIEEPKLTGNVTVSTWRNYWFNNKPIEEIQVGIFDLTFWDYPRGLTENEAIQSNYMQNKSVTLTNINEGTYFLAFLGEDDSTLRRFVVQIRAGETVSVEMFEI